MLWRWRKRKAYLVVNTCLLALLIGGIAYARSTDFGQIPIRKGEWIVGWYDQEALNEHSPILQVPSFGQEQNPDHGIDKLNLFITTQPDSFEGAKRVEIVLRELLGKIEARPNLPTVRLVSVSGDDRLSNLGISLDRRSINAVVRISVFEVQATFINNLFYSQPTGNGGFQQLSAATILNLAFDNDLPIHVESLPLDLELEDDSGLVIVPNPWLILDDGLSSGDVSDDYIQLSRFSYTPPKLASCSTVALTQNDGTKIAVIDISLSNVTQWRNRKLYLDPELDDVFLAESIAKCSYNSIAALFGFFVDPERRSSEGAMLAIDEIARRY